MRLLETLPGWPTADEPPVLMLLLILVGLPLAIAGVIFLAGMARRWRRTDPTLSADEQADALTGDMAYDVRHSMGLVSASPARALAADDQRAVGAQVENLQLGSGRAGDVEETVAAH